MGTDHTIFALSEGKVDFATKRNGRIYVSVTGGAKPRSNRRDAGPRHRLQPPTAGF